MEKLSLINEIFMILKEYFKKKSSIFIFSKNIHICLDFKQKNASINSVNKDALNTTNDVKSVEEINPVFNKLFFLFFLIFFFWQISFALQVIADLQGVQSLFLLCVIVLLPLFSKLITIIHIPDMLKNINLTTIYLLFFSPHRFWTQFYKERIKSKAVNEIKEETKESHKISEIGHYIINSNFTELGLSILIFSSYFLILYIDPYSISFLFNHTFLYLIIYRTISRSFEIIIAFGKDCFEKKNNGFIPPQERVILAISSLIENILNYSVVYYLLSIMNNTEKEYCFWQALAHSFKLNFFQGLELNMNKTFPDQLSLLSMLQFLTSFTLVIFSVAIYASGNKKMN